MSTSEDAKNSEQREALSFCRICPGFCGVRVTLEGNRVVAINGDKDHPITSGYICSKANLAVRMLHGPERLLHPLKRQPDGTFTRIPLEQALDEISDTVRALIEREGPDAVALYRGTANGLNSTASRTSLALLEAIGSTQNYSSMTIDQSAKWVTEGRLGSWEAGRQPMERSDVLMLFGSNPLVSLLGGLNNFRPLNPVRQLKEAKAAGMKLVVIDPRASETARHADVFLQPVPGTDASIAAGMLRIVLVEGWHDADFCERHAEGMAALRAAVEPFTPERVAKHAGVPAEDLRRAVEIFASEARTGAAASGTGPNMAPRSNLSEHLIECLNVICGRYAREGDAVPNPGAMSPPVPVHARVLPPSRSWERGTRSRLRPVGTLKNERMSGLLADEMLTPGKGRIRALISAGGNPASALPDLRRATEALRSLSLLVAVEPFMTTTAQLAHYILPPRLLYERADIPPTGFYEKTLYPKPFVQFTPALVEPPAGSEVADDWFIYWSIARRLGKQLTVNGTPLDMENAPGTEALLAIQLKGSAVPFDDMFKQPGGALRPDIQATVLAAPEGSSGRFAVMPPDVAHELGMVPEELRRPGQAGGHGHLLTVRRLREVVNTTAHALPDVRRRQPANAAYLHPSDMEMLGTAEGDVVEIRSDVGTITAPAKADDGVRPGVVSISHGWGGLPGQDQEAHPGSNVNDLVRCDERHVESINAMPSFSAIPVTLRKAPVLPASASSSTKTYEA